MSSILTAKQIQDGIAIKKFENLRINKLGLQVIDEKYRLIQDKTNELYPLFKLFKPRQFEIVNCDDQTFLEFFKDIINQLGIIGIVRKKPLRIYEEFPTTVSEEMDGDTGKTTSVMIQQSETLDMVPETIACYVIAALKEKLPFRKSVDYFDSEAIGFLVKHIAASIIDEEIKRNNITQFSSVDSLNNIQYYMESLMSGENLKRDKSGITEALMKYNAKEVSSELLALLAYDRYNDNHGQVTDLLRQTLTDDKTTTDTFFEKLGVGIDKEETPFMLEKAIRRVSILQRI